jgi:hypothetical protein
MANLPKPQDAMQFANGRLTTVAKRGLPLLNNARESERRLVPDAPLSPGMTI